MSVSTFTPPNPTTQLVTEYMASVDGDIAVMSRVAAAFAPHQNAPAAMNIVVDTGPVFSGVTLTEIPAQITPTITAPTANPRIDRVVIDQNTGMLSVVTGTASATPLPPGLPAGTVPIARITLSPGATAITNAMIVDERALLPVGTPARGGLLNVQRFLSNGVYTPTPGTNSVIVEVQGGGGSGGGSAAPASGRGSAGSGGASGGYAKSYLTTGFSGATVTVGDGGAETAAGAVDGNPGGASSFGTLVSALGGNPGLAGVSVVPPSFTWGSNITGLPTGANIMGVGQAGGGIGLVLSSTSVFGGAGGNAPFGANSSGSRGNDGSGSATINSGAGGGGGSSAAGMGAHAGGPGGRGYVTVYEYA